jgi:hypothetical protein
VKRFLNSLSIALGLTLLCTGVVYAQGGAADPASTGEIAGKLAALVAAATLVERIVEMIWDFFENNVLTVKSLIKNADDYVSWAQNQVFSARKNLLDAKDTDNRSSLEEVLQDAEKRLADYLKSDAYVSYKKKLSVPASIVLGLGVSFLAQLRMFVMLDILAPDTTGFLYFADIIVTGLVIGTGSAPVHSLIGVIQKTRDAVDAARGLYTGKALEEVRATLETLKGARLESKGGEETEQVRAIELERKARRMINL